MGKNYAEVVVPIERQEVQIKDDKGESHTLYVCELTALRQEALQAAMRQMRGDIPPVQFAEEHSNQVNALLLAQSLQDENGDSPPVDWILGLPRRLFESLRDKALAVNAVTMAGGQEQLEKN